jgi:copper oxidase (laccase) domain-containing protein
MRSSTKLDNWEVSLELESNAIIPHQVHGNTIISVSTCVSGTTDADGIIGTLNDPPFGVHTADCMPLVFITPTRALALHVSRHTLLAGILEESIDLLSGEQILHTYIGPHICEECFTFEHEGESIRAFRTRYPDASTEERGTIHISMDRVVDGYLKQFGVQHAIRDTRCTVETPELPSYRRWRAEGGTGTFPRFITSLRVYI